MYSNQQGIDAATYEYDAQYQPPATQERHREDSHVQTTEDHPWDANTPYDPPSPQDRHRDHGLTQATGDHPWDANTPYDPPSTEDRRWVDTQSSLGEAQYHPQSTDEERQWDDGITKQPVPRKRPDYRPTPLRWYFILGLITCLMVIMGLVVYARQSMPDSDNDAKIQHKRWDSDLDKSRLEARDGEIQERASNTDDYRGVTTYVSKVSSVVTVPASTVKFTTVVPSTIFSTVTVEGSTLVHSGSTSTKWVVVTYTSTMVSFTAITQTGGFSQSVIVGASTSYSMIQGSHGTPVSSVPYTFSFTSTQAMTMPGGVQTSGITQETTVVASSASEIEHSASTEFLSGGTTRTEAVGTTNVQSVGTTTQAASTFITIGEVTITEEYTLPPGSKESDKSKPDDPSDKSNKDDNKSDDNKSNDNKNNNDSNDKNKSDSNKDNNSNDNNSKDGSSKDNNDSNDDNSKDGDSKDNNNSNDDNNSNDNNSNDGNSNDDNSKDGNSNDNNSNDGNSKNGNSKDNKSGDNASEDPRPPPKPTTKPSAKVIDVVSVEPDKTVAKVEKVGPVTMVSEIPGGETVMVISQPPETIVTEISAYATTMDITVWGTDGLPTTTQVVSSYSGWFATIVKSVEPTTFVSTKSAVLTTITSTGDGSTTIASVKKGTTKSYSKTSTMMVTYTPTVTSADPEETGPVIGYKTKVYKITEGGYFLGKFLPPFLAVMLSIPARIIDFNAQLYQPFYALNLPNGALGPNSMTLHYSGWIGFVKPFTTLAQGQPVTFLSMLIVWCTALMTPLATEAIGVKMHGKCTNFNPVGCAAALGVSPTPTRALIALIAFTIVLLCLLLFFLRNWETGLHANPWSVAGIASLATNREIRPQRSTERKIAKEMAEKRYGFGYFENSRGQTEYGLVLYDDAGETLQGQDNMGTISEVSSVDSLDVTRKKRRGNPFIALGIIWRLCFMLFLAGLMVLTLYYGITFKTQDSFQGFMTSQTFGIRFMFAVLGVIISFGWTALFISVAMIVPYQVMAHSPQSASNSILLTRPTNPFSGIWSALKHGQPFPAVVAFMTILSEFMPILLANIPYTLTQTEITHDICLHMSVVILGLMVLTLGGSFFIRYPHMPVDPRSIAGAMYYVSESGMLNQFSGMASLSNEERKKRVQELGGRYWYGDILTRAGATRPAVDRDDGTLTDAAPEPQPQPMRQNIDTSYHGYQA
ncbi:Zonadhesin [Ilyonectria robusta]